MKITDEMVNAALNAYCDCDSDGELDPMRAALTAALPYLQPVDVASVRRQAFEEAANICAEYAKSFQEGLCHYGDADKDSGRGRQEGHIDAGNELASAIRALSAEPARGEQWQPIETAPKDGTEKYTWNGRRHHVAKFDKVENSWVSSFTTVTKRLPLSPQPTHWMPLPSAPTPGEEA